MRRSHPDVPNISNTRYKQFRGLMDEEVVITTARGNDVDASAYNILTGFTHQKALDDTEAARDDSLEVEGIDVAVQSIHSYSQAPMSFSLGSVPGVEVRLLFVPDPRVTATGKLWVPSEMELIGPGTGSVDLLLYELGDQPEVIIKGLSAGPERIQEEVQAFFDVLGALATTGV